MKLFKMKLHFPFLLLILFMTSQLDAQIVCQFSWDSGGPVTDADIGPDGISVSASAISDVGGVGGTNGLNAGLPKRDVGLEIPGSPTFDINGIDVSFDYQREESGGTFVQRGSSLVIRGCANLSVTYRVDDGAGSFVTVNSGNVFSIPFDDIYRNYRFTYLPSTGEGALSVDGTTVWTNDGPDLRNLYWTGSGNLFVGNGMDGTGYDKTFLDNLIIANIFDSALPVELLFFDATVKKAEQVHCNWATASETGNDYFEVQRSANGADWNAIGRVEGAINSNSELYYDFSDYSPRIGTSYYRLKQVDVGGRFEYSQSVSVVFERNNSDQVFIFPNPSNGVLNIRTEFAFSEVQILDIYGRLLKTLRLSESVLVKSGKIDLSDLAKGVYYLRINESSQMFVLH